MTCVFIGSFSINDLTIFGCVIDKQYDSLSDLITSFGIAKKQTKKIYNILSTGTQNYSVISVNPDLWTPRTAL